jgi:hypothetical protein
MGNKVDLDIVFRFCGASAVTWRIKGQHDLVVAASPEWLLNCRHLSMYLVRMNMISPVR